MTGTRSSEGFDLRRRKILFRSWHRGIREMDLIMGRFADAHLDSLSEAELGALESLMELPDPEVLSWFTGECPVPAPSDTPLFRRIRAFYFGKV